MVPDFNNNTYDYYITVKNDIKDIEVLAIAENKNSKIQIEGNSNLKEGLNLIKVQVTSPDKTSSSTYLINVTKTNDLESANTNLETLAIENYLLYPAFDNTVTNYNVEVGDDTEQINLLAIPEDENATVEINKEDTLKEGNNVIKITVTARNTYTKKEYNINVYKRNTQEEQVYNQEQEDNKNKLNNIYETEKTSNEQLQEQQKQEEVIIENKETQENKTTKSIKDIVIIISLLILILIIGISVIWYKKKRQKKI